MRLEDKRKSNDLKKIVHELENVIKQITLNRLVSDELISEIDTFKSQIESQIKSPNPKSIVMMRASWKTIQNILEGTAVNAISPSLIEMINSVLK